MADSLTLSGVSAWGGASARVPAGQHGCSELGSLADTRGQGSEIGDVCGDGLDSARGRCPSTGADSIRGHYSGYPSPTAVSPVGSERVGSRRLDYGHLLTFVDDELVSAKSPRTEEGDSLVGHRRPVHETACWNGEEEDWPRLSVRSEERPGLEGTFDVLYAGTRRHNERPVWASGSKRIYSNVDGNEDGPGRWCIAVGSDAPLTGRRHLQGVLPHGTHPSEPPHICAEWEVFDTEQRRWVPAPGTSVSLADPPPHLVVEHAGLSPRPCIPGGSARVPHTGSVCFSRANRQCVNPDADPLDEDALLKPPLKRCGLGRVVSPATVRTGDSLHSDIVGSAPLQPDTLVTVVEINGRRARIVAPVCGWLSLHTQGCALVVAADESVAASDASSSPPASPRRRCDALGCTVTDATPPAICTVAQGGPADVAGLHVGDAVVWVRPMLGATGSLGGDVLVPRGAEEILEATQGVQKVQIGFMREGRNHVCVAVVSDTLSPLLGGSSPSGSPTGGLPLPRFTSATSEMVDTPDTVPAHDPPGADDDPDPLRELPREGEEGIDGPGGAEEPEDAGAGDSVGPDGAGVVGVQVELMDLAPVSEGRTLTGTSEPPRLAAGAVPSVSRRSSAVSSSSRRGSAHMLPALCGADAAQMVAAAAAARGVWSVALETLPVGMGAVAKATRRQLFSALCPAVNGSGSAPSQCVNLAACVQNHALFTCLLGQEFAGSGAAESFDRAVAGSFAAASAALRPRGGPTPNVAAYGIDRKNFRVLLEALRRHVDLFVVYGCDHGPVHVDAAARAVPLLATWGAAVLEPKAVVSQAAAHGSGGKDQCGFTDFCTWVSAQGLRDFVAPGSTPLPPASGRRDRAGSRSTTTTASASPVRGARSAASGVLPPPSLSFLAAGLMVRRAASGPLGGALSSARRGRPRATNTLQAAGARDTSLPSRVGPSPSPVSVRGKRSGSAPRPSRRRTASKSAPQPHRRALQQPASSLRPQQVVPTRAQPRSAGTSPVGVSETSKSRSVTRSVDRPVKKPGARLPPPPASPPRPTPAAVQS